MNGLGEPRHRQSDPGVWRSLNRLLLLLIVVASSVIAVLALIPQLREVRGMTAKRDELRQKVEREKELLAARSREESLLQNDPEYVEVIARDRLDVMKEGETIFRIEGARPSPPKPGTFKRNE